MNYESRNQERGILLVESMVAITVIIFGLLAIMTLVSRSLSLNRVVSDQYIAAHLAAEGVEIVKDVVDTNYLQDQAFNQGLTPGDYNIDYEFVSKNENLRYDPNEGYNHTNGILTPFKRVIKIENFDDPDSGNVVEIKVNSIVTWTTRGGGKFEINAEDHFFNWRQ